MGLVDLTGDCYEADSDIPVRVGQNRCDILVVDSCQFLELCASDFVDGGLYGVRNFECDESFEIWSAHFAVLSTGSVATRYYFRLVKRNNHRMEFAPVSGCGLVRFQWKMIIADRKSGMKTSEIVLSSLMRI